MATEDDKTKAEEPTLDTSDSLRDNAEPVFKTKLLKKDKDWWKERMSHVKPHIRLKTEKQVLQWSLLAVRLGSLADAISSTILTPNFPFLVSQGSHPDSFDSTAPFGFVAATHFLPMTAFVASAITSAFIGGWSDRYGRRPFLLACVGASVLGSIAKYLARDSFWGFCAANR